ncbi:MAG: high frequency lysogenization protein HflD [Thalassotalea sp.]
MNLTQQTYTLAAIFQIAKHVQSVARSGKIEHDALETMLASTLVTSPDDSLDVYGGSLSNLSLGLTTLIDQLGNESKSKDPELTRYIVCLLALERKLTKNSKLMATLAARIEQAKRQTDHFEITSETLLASLASIYSDVVSPIGTKIQIAGDPTLLKQTNNQHKIRALLLAGIRSVVLWRQLGGKRRNIIFARSKILACAKDLLSKT